MGDWVWVCGCVHILAWVLRCGYVDACVHACTPSSICAGSVPCQIKEVCGCIGVGAWVCMCVCVYVCGCFPSPVCAGPVPCRVVKFFFWEQGSDNVCERFRTIELFKGFDVQFLETGLWDPPSTFRTSQLIVYV